jgi:competence protein ComGC
LVKLTLCHNLSRNIQILLWIAWAAAKEYDLALEVLLCGRAVKNMTNLQVIPVFLLALIGATALPIAALAPQQEKQQPKKDSKTGNDSMTGCVDEQNGNYVLTNDRDLALIAHLEADGFPTEAFAKHMGHKVTVRGTVVPGSSEPTFKVRSVTPVSDTCAPQQQREPKAP